MEKHRKCGIENMLLCYLASGSVQEYSEGGFRVLSEVKFVVVDDSRSVRQKLLSTLELKRIVWMLIHINFKEDAESVSVLTPSDKTDKEHGLEPDYPTYYMQRCLPKKMLTQSPFYIHSNVRVKCN
ncbi:hypothetical protein STEG23_034814 [Scotinomys teguina]